MQRGKYSLVFSFFLALVRWTPSFGPKSGVAKVEPAGSVLLVVLSCNRGWRPVPATRNCLTLAVEPTGTPASALMRR